MEKNSKKGLPKATYRYKKNNKTYNIRVDRIVACLIIIVVLVVLICSCARSCGSSKKSAPASSQKTTENTTEQASDTSENASASSENKPAAKTISMNSDDVKCGDLILIDGSNPYEFVDSDVDITPIADLKNDYYTTSDLVISLDSNTINHLNDMMEAFNKETGISDIRIISAYRTYDEQQEKYSSGSASTAPGYSEYHSGRTFSMAIFSSDGTSDYYKPNGDYAWIKEHAAEYGFIQRYPEGKDSETGESEITYIYRYVGVPHSLYMYQNDMCLEEYETFIKGYSFESPLQITNTDGSSYLVYYVAASDGGTTPVQIPENSQYEISGNNSDGFIVTVIS